jgi:hypothetical protein
VPTLLIAVPPEQRQRLERSFFWRADLRRTLALPADLLSVARTLGPDLIIVMSDGPVPEVQATLDQIRQDAATRDSVVVILSRTPVEVAAFAQSGPSLVLPYDFDESDVGSAPWHARVEELLRMRSRRETRVVSEFDVEVWFGEGALRRQRPARGLNLSSRGILLALAEPILVGTRVDIAFVAAAGLPQVSVVGEVVRSAETADPRWLAGVHFVVVRKDSRLAIRDTLRALRPDRPAADDGG